MNQYQNQIYAVLKQNYQTYISLYYLRRHIVLNASMQNLYSAAVETLPNCATLPVKCSLSTAMHVSVYEKIDCLMTIEHVLNAA